MKRLWILSVAAALCACPPAENGSDDPKTNDGGEVDASELPEWKRELLPDGELAAEQVFIFNNGAEPETLDPHLKTGVPEGRLGQALFECLVTLHPETLAPLPGAAESWEVSEDGTVYTFTLREDGKWSNGQAVTAEDFHASWQRALTPATACQYAYMFDPIVGATAFRNGETEDFATVGVEVVDSRTLKVTLAAPCAYFLDLVAFDTLSPVPMWVVEEHGEQWTRPEHLVGNGAFVVESWEPNQRIVMVPNEHYWDRDFVTLERLIALPLENMETSYRKFQQDECHWMTDVPIAKIEEMMRLPEFYVTPYLGSYYYRFNTTRPPLNDPRVRMALSLSIDRSVITRDILKAGQIPATYFCPELPGYQPPAGLEEDRERARELLAEAGYPGGEGFPAISLLYNTLEAHKQVAEVLVQQWEENLNITITPRNTEWKVYLNEVDTFNYDIARAGWIGDYVDPNTFLDLWVTDGGNNKTGWSNARYDELIEAARTEQDVEARMALFHEAEEILIEREFPVLPIYIYVNKGLLKSSVRGWFENVRDQHPYKFIWIEASE